jgi:hypothetical protein
MRVAVLGSWADDPSLPWKETPEAFQAACRRIGRELVQHGHSLIVGSDRKRTADRHAALDALDALDALGELPSARWPHQDRAPKTQSGCVYRAKDEQSRRLCRGSTVPLSSISTFDRDVPALGPFRCS